MRRVCGISLPEASTLCTRIATLVQMRRSAEPSIRVTLVGPGGKELTVESNVDAKQVKDAVSKAQTRALEESPGKTFVDDHTVCVHVCGPEIPNVTLVDLPGFHTANDTDTKTVNAMVQRYIEMPGTLVLHVVKGDQDYASLLGNDFMRQTGKSKGGEGRVTVLTHCDKLEQSAPGDTQRLQITLDATCENSSSTFAIHGCAQDQSEEDAALRHLSGMDERVEVGAKPLAAHLEERMRVHLATQYPKAVAKLEESLSETLRRLELIKEQTPLEVLFEMSARVQATHQAKRQGLMNELRLTLDQMTRSIKDFTLEPVTGVKCSTCQLQLIDSFDEPLEVGKLVYYHQPPDETNSPFRVTEVNESKKTITLKRKADDEAETRVVVQKDSTGAFPGVFSAETDSSGSMAEDIKQLAADRGVRNVVHADRQPIIARYAEEFGHHYQKSMQTTLKTIRTSVSDHFDAAFSEGVPEMAKPAAARLRALMRTEESEALSVADAAINAMAAHNTMPDLIFSPNEHYLNSLIQKMVESDKGMATDDGGARHIYHNVRAYIKVQTKYISELGSKELLRTMVLNNEERFHRLLTAKAAACVDLIKEPSSIARERATLLNRKSILEEALKKLQSVAI